jgi:two-component system alkaline phosphatase synthesis response regulator PhoP
MVRKKASPEKSPSRSNSLEDRMRLLILDDKKAGSERSPGQDSRNTSPEDKRKILVVDDEPNVRKLLRTVLNKKFTVLEAEDGSQAVNVASTEKPDLILMDIMMPKMDGYTSCYALKSEPATRSIPILMLTAIDLRLNLQLSKEIGADGYITKPFNSKDLLDNITQVLSTA